MLNLTAEGRSLVEGVAQRNHVSFDAAATLLAALERGNGTQAQFNHFELGGMGQWSQGGMIMIGDMFNNGLKYKVDQLCNDLSNLLRTHQLFEIRDSFSATGGSWWPSSFGSPASSGSQNDMSYATFPAIRRLALRRNGQVTLYDTGDHQIGGFSQQQGGNDQNLTFTSQYGTVRLYDLAQIPLGADPQPQQTPQPFSQPAFTPPAFVPQNQPAPSWQSAPVQQNNPPQEPWPPAPASGDDGDMFAKIERLHGLMQKGILSEAEFAAKKKDLLDRL
ncbi:MAG: SHOCT domain-containing protein [Beijerinckiaceae bacterium]|nr:SHOCT domain-containing protein [Beijerinckiaceae bacterium]